MYLKEIYSLVFEKKSISKEVLSELGFWMEEWLMAFMRNAETSFNL
jgi:hypothetical protein